MYINTYGCDKFPSQYVYSNVSNGTDGGDYYYKLRYGRMFLPICTNPRAQPVLSSIVFITFITLCGFILINITIAAVAAGINDRLDALRREDLEVEMGIHPALSVLSSVQLSRPTLLTDSNMLLLLMQQVWKEHEEYSKKMARLSTADKIAKTKEKNQELALTAMQKGSLSHQIEHLSATNHGEHGRVESLESVEMHDTAHEDSIYSKLFLCEWRYQSMLMRDLTGHLSYHILVAFLVILAAFTEMLVLQKASSSSYAEKVQIMLQILFTLDLYCRIVATYPNYPSFFKNRWNAFDVAVVAVTWIPIINLAFQGNATKIIGRLPYLFCTHCFMY